MQPPGPSRGDDPFQEDDATTSEYGGRADDGALGLWLFRYELSGTEPTGFEWKEAETMGGDTGRGATGVGFGAGRRCFSPSDGAMLAEAGQRKGEETVGNANHPGETDFFTQAEAKNNSARTEVRSLTALGHGETWVRRGWMLVECPVLASTCTY